MNPFSFSLRAATCLFGLLAASTAFAKDAGRIEASTLSALMALPENAHAALELQLPGEASARTVTLERVQVYASDAHVWVAQAEGLREIPRSDLHHFIARDGKRRLVLSLHADGRGGDGVLVDEQGGIWRLDAQMDGSALRLAATDANAPLADGSIPEGDCLGGLDGPEPVRTALPDARLVPPSPDTATRQARVAVDTDNEFMSLKFSNNTTNANNYIASLMAAMSVFYERDAGQGGGSVQLQLGDVVLRPSNVPDPYPSTTATPQLTQLSEFSGEWMNNQSGIQRAFAMLLSGKSASANSASGIAWIVTNGSYCAATGQVQGANVYGHYSASRVFRHISNTVPNDAPLVAHELGHNFGLSHTHCTNGSGAFPSSSGTLDQCYSGETSSQGSCYSGAVSCPAGGQGTLMSYCHVSGCNTTNLTTIHPVQVTTLNNRLASQPSTCIVPLGQPNQSPTISFPQGNIDVTEDVPSTITGISFIDPDAGAGSLTAAFSVPSGSLSASTGGGVTVSGSGTSRVLNGTLTALNSFISGGNLTFTTASNATANVTLTVAINDNGNTGTGGAQNDSGTKTLAVTAVNDAPTLTAPGMLRVNMGATAVSEVSFADVDAGSGNLVVTLASAQVNSSGTSSGGVTVGGTAASRTYTGTLANLNAYFAANKATVTPAGAFSSGTLSITINDQGNTGSGGAKSASANVNLEAVLFADGFE